MRILRHLSFSNVIAMLALFVALGGAAYASTKINGKTIVNGSIGGGKLKNETIGANKIKKGVITGVQIEPGSISSSSINESTLGTVPAAQTANMATTAQTATKATKATTATRATTATKAESAKHAETAESAKHAETAGHASSADSATNATHAATADSAGHADSATTAETATNATNATSAADAQKLNGVTAAELQLSCRAGTEFYGGMCWDESTRPAKLWLGAVTECGNLGGRLPTIEELIAFVLRPGEQVESQTWSGDVDSLEAGPVKEKVFTTDETGRSTSVGGLLGYRCVFHQSN